MEAKNTRPARRRGANAADAPAPRDGLANTELDVRAAVTRRYRVQLGLLVLFFLSVVVFHHVGLAVGWIVLLLIAGAVLWRCPACGRRLDRWPPETCTGCGARLRGARPDG
jgi:hypothetical protein